MGRPFDILFEEGRMGRPFDKLNKHDKTVWGALDADTKANTLREDTHALWREIHAVKDLMQQRADQIQANDESIQRLRDETAALVKRVEGLRK